MGILNLGMDWMGADAAYTLRCRYIVDSLLSSGKAYNLRDKILYEDMNRESYFEQTSCLQNIDLQNVIYAFICR